MVGREIRGSKHPTTKVRYDFAAMIGKTVSSYKITDKLGEGGMGTVYRATDTRLGREVAIKFSGERFSERFEREARAIAALNHPNVCTLYDVGPDYLVMELVEGEAPKGPMPLPQALDVARQIADALKAAHEKGITHRDLKPANLRITPEGKVKVLDFGLARLGSSTSQESPQNSPTLMSVAATQAGMILGTASYMSPEQARGKPADRRADIWAFGVVLYELLTGRPLFEEENVSDTIAGVLKSDPDWTLVPPQVRRLLKRCLERDATKRLQDIGDVWDLLDEAPSVPSTPARRSVLWPVVASAALLAALVLAAMLLRPDPLPEVTRFQIAAPAGSRLGLGTPAPSPDGRSLAYVVIDSNGVQRIYLRRLDRTTPEVLAGTEGAVHPFWSPDGRSLAFVADNILKRIDIDKGTSTILADRITGPWHGDWNSRGDILAQVLGGIVRVSDQGATAPTVVIDRNEEIQAGHPAFLDDKRFLFRSQSESAMSIKLGAVDSKETHIVVEKVDSAPLLARTPAGKSYILYLKDSNLVSHELDPAAGKVKGEPSVLVPEIGRVANPAVKPAVGVSRDAGVLAYQTGVLGSEEFTWFDRAGNRSGSIPIKLTTGNFRLSPNGSFLAYRGEDGSLWVLDIARGSTTRLTSDTINNLVWSHDETKVAFRGLQKPGISIVNIDGTGEQTIWDRQAAPRSWSDKGIVFTDGAGAVHLLPPGGQKPELIADGSFADARLSPDGKFIAVDSIESGRREIYIQPLLPLKGRTRVSINGGSRPSWRRDGKELYFVGPDSTIMAANVTLSPTVSVGVPVQMFRVAGGITAYDIEPDGRRFLIVTPSATLPDNPITVVLNWWVELKR
jgi:Tol biopolymer transport system component/predicted Ser/Thr protein kinase